MLVKSRRVLVATLLAAAAVLAGCDRSTPVVSVPAAIEVTDDATGHYCGMLLAEHDGPKGQIHLASRSEPVWFSSVRDTVSFLRLPEEARDIAAIYVNDMGKASNWERPEQGTWIDAREAWFVIESDRRGGMGAPEAVPFSEQAAAEKFQSEHGGRLVKLADIPDDYVLGPVEAQDQGGQSSQGHGDHSGHGESAAHTDHSGQAGESGQARPAGHSGHSH